MRMGVGNSLPLVTIAVIGNTMARKTSLIKTLQNVDRTRVLTNRNPESKVDETTKVFKVEKLEIENFPVQLIDMGGNEIYHTTYQLALHQNCIPLIVVNMAQYRDLIWYRECYKSKIASYIVIPERQSFIFIHDEKY